MTIAEGATKAGFALQNYNPDVLTCIANLSTDEVFTPPEFANRMLDTLESAWAEANGGASIWADPEITFLDPFTKSGVFLREITARLGEGLAERIPDLQQRVDHILTKQVFGIATTTLTSLVARRSLYCSKDATGPHSITKSFDRDWGHVWFERTEHTWAGDRCGYCGASKKRYDRSAALETHAYAFIHTSDPKRSLAKQFGADVQFDVIIGNPPYQLGDEGVVANAHRIASATPIYDRFVEQAKRLEPRFLTMVIPSRWMAGGRGLDAFRRTMLADRSLRVLVDYPAATDVFGPDVRVSGGVCFFLREHGYLGETRVTTVRGAQVSGPIERSLDEHDVFVRDVEAVAIVNNVLAHQSAPVTALFSSGFGLDTNFSDYHDEEQAGDLVLHLNVGGMGHKRATKRVSRAAVPRNLQIAESWKVLVPSAAGYGAEQLYDRVLGQPILSGPGEVGTQTYRVIGPFASEDEARSFVSYYCTKFFRFLVSLRKVTQHAAPAVYSWVPQQTWDRCWTDEALFQQYGIDEAGQAYIHTRIRDVDWAAGSGA